MRGTHAQARRGERKFTPIFITVRYDYKALRRLWRVSWCAEGSEWLTSKDLVSDMKELHGSDGCVIVWPDAIKSELDNDRAQYEAQLIARLKRPLKETIMVR